MNRFRLKVHEIIFEADTLLGKIFDILLLVMILLSVGVVMLESVEGYRLEWFWIFDIFEWVFTILFSTFFYLQFAPSHPEPHNHCLFVSRLDI